MVSGADVYIHAWWNISDHQSANQLRDEHGKDPKTIVSNFEILKNGYETQQSSLFYVFVLF